MMQRLFSFLLEGDESPWDEEEMDARSEENHQGHEIRDDAGARRKPVGLPQLSDSTSEWNAWIWRETLEEYWQGCWRDEISAMRDSLEETPKEGKEGDDPPTGYLGRKDGQDEGEEPEEPNKSISVDRFTLKLAGDELKTMEIPERRQRETVYGVGERRVEKRLGTRPRGAEEEPTSSTSKTSRTHRSQHRERR